MVYAQYYAGRQTSIPRPWGLFSSYKKKSKPRLYKNHRLTRVLCLFSTHYLFCFAADKKFEVTAVERGYEVDMRLKIKKVGRSTFGTYSCISKNSLGDTDGTIKLYCKYLYNINYIYFLPLIREWVLCLCSSVGPKN